jgi:acyl carrier protein
MTDLTSGSPEGRVLRVVDRLLAERSLSGAVRPDDDLRRVGLTSLDMVNLVLAVEAEFDLLIPEVGIKPANFRSITTISAMVTTLLEGAIERDP